MPSISTTSFRALAVFFLVSSVWGGGLLRGVPPTEPTDVDEPEVTLRHIPPTPKAETATFVNPSIKNLPIDYCLAYMDLNGPERRGIDCGQPVATRFCQEQGYTSSTGYICMYYSHGATYILGMDDINPESDKTLGLGFHTFFSNISCSA